MLQKVQYLHLIYINKKNKPRKLKEESQKILTAQKKFYAQRKISAELRIVFLQS